jgi:hypothetical protein
MLRAEGCDMALPFLCCGMAHTLDVRPAGPAQAMRDPPGSVRGTPRLEPGAGSALELVRDLTADAFVYVGTHRFQAVSKRGKALAFERSARLAACAANIVGGACRRRDRVERKHGLLHCGASARGPVTVHARKPGSGRPPATLLRRRETGLLRRHTAITEPTTSAMPMNICAFSRSPRNAHPRTAAMMGVTKV